MTGSMTKAALSCLGAVAFALLIAPAARAECNMPGQAPIIPDGATATVEQMSAAHTAVQSYVNLLQSYQDCQEARIKLAPRGTKADDLQKLRDLGNAAITQAEALQNNYKTQVTAYKARTAK